MPVYVQYTYHLYCLNAFQNHQFAAAFFHVDGSASLEKKRHLGSCDFKDPTIANSP